MNIFGIGTDIVSLDRIRKIKEKRRVAEYILLEDELNIFNNSLDQTQYLGSRLAAKEAVIKAFPGKLTYHDFSVVLTQGKPTILFRDEDNSRYKVLLSIAHEIDNSTSFAIVYNT